MAPDLAWRHLAKTFTLIELFIFHEKLPENFHPADAIEVYEGPINVRDRSILRFLLHVWDRYEYCFELSAVSTWGADHQQAFVNWANGSTLGEPCRYFR